VTTTDTNDYLSYSYKKDIDLSEAQYQAIKSWSEQQRQNGDYGDYSAIGNNCITFMYDALVAGGIAPKNAKLFSDIWPTWNGDEIDQIISDYYKGLDLRSLWEIEGLPMDIISPTLGTTPDPLVKTIIYVDPLILDLDGDGLEITPLSRGVLFDADGDTIKTGTAWAGADDGMLVWDRNGNGLIDSGRELFGDETVLANGTKAAHGFAALSELDVGSTVGGATVGAGDSVFDAKDAQFSNLHIWRDLNQDGVNQAGELQTLAQTGITSIGLANTNPNTNYGDAILTHSGSFTRTDGSTGQAGSFILAQNNFVRSFVPITVSAAAQALPDFKGGGWVRDLREAATLNPELIADFNQAKDAPTRAGYVAAVANLLLEWGNESAFASASKQASTGRRLRPDSERPGRCARARLDELGHQGQRCRSKQLSRHLERSRPQQVRRHARTHGGWSGEDSCL
jgi:hypothetical protein